MSVVVVLVGVGPDPNGGSTYTIRGNVMLLVISTDEGAVWLALIDTPHTGISVMVAKTLVRSSITIRLKMDGLHAGKDTVAYTVVFLYPR